MFMYPDLFATTGSTAHGSDLMQQVCEICLDLHRQSMDHDPASRHKGVQKLLIPAAYHESNGRGHLHSGRQLPAADYPGHGETEAHGNAANYGDRTSPEKSNPPLLPPAEWMRNNKSGAPNRRFHDTRQFPHSPTPRRTAPPMIRGGGPPE
jgi:hypothetical protein